MNLGTPPGELNWIRRAFLKLISTPAWVQTWGESGLGWFFASEKDLKQNGVVVLGTLVQANNVMFSPGDDDYPGELLFSLSEPANPTALLNVANRVFRLKGNPCEDPQEAYFSDYLADEMIRVQGAKVPHSLSGPGHYHISTTVFYRKHLPGGYLKSSIYPLLVSKQTLTAMVLPKECWGEEGWRMHNRHSD